MQAHSVPGARHRVPSRTDHIIVVGLHRGPAFFSRSTPSIAPSTRLSTHPAHRNRRSSTAMASAGTPPTALPASATETKVSFTNPKGERLVGIFVDTGSPNAVLLCHGYIANKHMCQFDALAAALAAAGLSSLRFDHPCAWRGESELKGPFLMGNHDDEVADMAAAAEYLRTEQGKTVTGILGHSKGGTNVMQYAAQHGDIPKVVNLAGRWRCREGVLKRFGEDIFERLEAAGSEGLPRTEGRELTWTMTLPDFLNRAERPMEEYAAAIKANGNVQLLFLHGREDATIPWEESEEAAAAAGGKLVVVSGDHNFRDAKDADAMITRVVEWFV